MNPTWSSDTPPDPWKLTVGGALRAGVRGLALFFVIFGGLIALLALRIVEAPFFGQRRPWTPCITVFVCRLSLRIIGLALVTQGKVAPKSRAIVANHSSWIDIFVLNAERPLYFVAKSEVASWAGIGWLARATGTLFVRRERRAAQAQTKELEARLLADHCLLFFPEGTSTDGQRVLAFKPTLFAAFFSEALADTLWVQPVSLAYVPGQDMGARYYAWWGDMDFAGHLLKILATPHQGSVKVTWHPPLEVAAFSDRKALAQAAEDAVRAGYAQVGAS